MGAVSVRPTNGVSYGLKYIVLTADATAKLVDFDFRIGTNDLRYELVASVIITAETTNVVTNPADLAISYPSQGVVRVAGTLVAGSVIHLIAQRDSLA